MCLVFHVSYKEEKNSYSDDKKYLLFIIKEN